MNQWPGVIHTVTGCLFVLLLSIQGNRRGVNIRRSETMTAFWFDDYDSGPKSHVLKEKNLTLFPAPPTFTTSCGSMASTQSVTSLLLWERVVVTILLSPGTSCSWNPKAPTPSIPPHGSSQSGSCSKLRESELTRVLGFKTQLQNNT